MSWGYSVAYTNITGGNYRGTPWTASTIQNAYGMIGRLSGITRRGNIRVGSVDTDIAELLAAGVIVVIAAGNNFEKIDATGGLDYNNYWTSSVSGNIYYHRGCSPYSDNAVVVGSIAETTAYAQETKSTFSNHGPGVTISAPGSYIVSSTSQTNQYTGVAYNENAAFKQVNISGTSMASPQVAGVISLYLQQNPSATPAQVKSWLSSTTISGQDRIYSTGLDNDYTNQASIWGGNQNYLFWPYATLGITHRASGIQIKGPVTFRMP
jgi:subtilisin family serine protease